MRFRVDGCDVEVPDDGASLLEVLRDRLGRRTAKDGCSPQGQCGCCTVLVDGVPRVACVTPARRVAGRAITTLEGLADGDRTRWAEAFAAAGASQCGFCTPGIILRLSALEGGTAPGPAARAGDATEGAPSATAEAGASGADGAVETALLAHLCRCTGWRTILDAARTAMNRADAPAPARDLEAASRRAALEGGTHQRVGAEVARGHGGFADDCAPDGALVAVPDGRGGWALGETLSEARAVATAAGKTPGRRSGAALFHPLEVPAGNWDLTLRTTWVEPAYVETDASWCRPGGEPATPLANGGAFGGKLTSVAPAAARELATRWGRPVRVLLSRDDVVRMGPKRPPMAAGVCTDGSGVIRVVRTPGIAAAIAAGAPRVRVEEVHVAGPQTSAQVRAAGWAEAAVLTAALDRLAANPAFSSGAGSASSSGASPASGSGAGPVSGSSGGSGAATVRSPSGATAAAEVDVDADGLPGAVRIELSCGDPLDHVVLRSYAVGAAHMALGWVCSEGIAVDGSGVPQDLTIRSFGILRARDTPPIDVVIDEARRPAVNGSDAVFAAVAAATWLAQGLPSEWPTRRGRFH